MQLQEPHTIAEAMALHALLPVGEHPRPGVDADDLGVGQR
jgi:hypothetical protein